MEKNQQFGFYLDQTRCVGCRTCQMACKDGKDSPLGVNFRRVVEFEGGAWLTENPDTPTPVGVFAYYTSIACNHCDDPACIKACPTGAMHKGLYGIVEVNQSRCIGCKACAMACPYGAPQFDSRQGHMSKCDGCKTRLEENLAPLCVESCPFRALEAGSITELRAKHGHAASIAPLPPYERTRPNLCLKPEKNSQPSGDSRGIFHLPQNHSEVNHDIV